MSTWLYEHVPETWAAGLEKRLFNFESVRGIDQAVNGAHVLSLITPCVRIDSRQEKG